MVDGDIRITAKGLFKRLADTAARREEIHHDLTGTQRGYQWLGREVEAGLTRSVSHGFHPAGER